MHLLAVEPRDIAAEELGLLLGAPAPTTLAEIVICGGRGERLVLGVLGASHVVTAAVPGQRITEQVSCDAVAAGGRELPRCAELAGYRLTTTTRDVPRAELVHTAAELRGLAEGDSWLCGAFPGPGTALTVLTGRALTGGGWRWASWHLYPGRRRCAIVTTRSRWTPT